MRTFRRFDRQMVTFCCVIMGTAFLAVGSAYGLHMSKMPMNLQTTVTAPRDRAISLKLPLLQPEFHWTFLSKQNFLTGKLVLYITRSGETTTIIIFENGKMSEGWESLPVPNSKGGEIYFMLQSFKKYPTAPGDRLKIELQVKNDLNGIGPTETGILPAGTYTSEGTYSGLIDEYTLSDTILKNIPEEKVADARAAFRKMYEFKAFLENWETQWPLKITGDEGWLSREQRRQYEKLLSEMPNQTSTDNNDEEWELKPLFTVEDLAGKKVQKDALKGKAVLIYFWNTQDVSCQDQFQIFDKIIQTYKEKDIAFMAITDEPKEVVGNFMQKHDYKIPIYLAKDKAVSKSFPIQSTPAALLIGRKAKGVFILYEKPGDAGQIKGPVRVPMTEEMVSQTIQGYLETYPIHDAIERGNVERVKMLLAENPALVKAKDNRGCTPLIYAACNNKKEMAEVLLANNADVNAKGMHGQTPLHETAFYNGTDVAALLLINKANVNAKNNQGRTPLHMAADRNNKDVAELLLVNKADVTAKDKDGQTPLKLAETKNSKDVVDLLRKHGAKD